MKNWKTTVAGIATAVFGFILFSPHYFPPWAVDVAKYATAGGLAAMGLLSKDSTTTSTQQQVNAETRKENDKIAAQV